MPDKKIDIVIVKQTISAPSRKLSAKWTFELDEEEEVRKKPETREEEADEIIHRLKTAPRKKKGLGAEHGSDLEKEIMEVLSAKIAKEIDEQMIITAEQWQKK